MDWLSTFPQTDGASNALIKTETLISGGQAEYGFPDWSQCNPRVRCRLG